MFVRLAIGGRIAFQHSVTASSFDPGRAFRELRSRATLRQPSSWQAGVVPPGGAPDRPGTCLRNMHGGAASIDAGSLRLRITLSSPLHFTNASRSVPGERE